MERLLDGVKTYYNKYQSLPNVPTRICTGQNGERFRNEVWLFHSPSLFTKHHAQFNDWTMMSKIEPSGGNCTGREGDVVPMLLSTSNLVKHQAAVRSKQYCATSGTVCNFAKKIPRPHLLFELCTSEIEEEYDKKWEAVALPFCLLGCEMVSDGAA